MELGKPWINLGDYRRTRLMEAHYEAGIAVKMLSDGLTRNAAGKAFQAWKSFLAAIS